MPHPWGLGFLHLDQLAMVELRPSHHLVEVALVGWGYSSVDWSEFLNLDHVSVDVPVVNNRVVLRSCVGGMLHQGVQRLLDVVLLPYLL